MAKLGQAAFSSGELDPALHARADLAIYQTGLAICENFIVRGQGGVENRPGYEFKNEVKDSDDAVRLIPFAFNDDDTYMLEFGPEYLRVQRNGEQVLLPSAPSAWVTATSYTAGDHVANGGTNYHCTVDHTSAGTSEPGVGATWTDFWHPLVNDIVEIETPYVAGDLRFIDYQQNGSILVLTVDGQDPRKLTRIDHHQWTIEDIDFSPAIDAPTGVVVTASSANTEKTYEYVITAINSDGEESIPSTAGTDTNFESMNGDATKYNDITWSAVTGAVSYSIYKEAQGVFGFIGSATSLSFRDTGLAAKVADTPPADRDPFAATAGQPRTVAYHEQRLVFGGADPQNVELSQVGNYFNFTMSEPARDSDAMSLDIVTSRIAQIRYVVSQGDLMVFTAGAEVRITSGDNPFILENIRRRVQSGYGCAQGVKPQLMGDKILFVQRGGQIIRDFAYSFEADKFTGKEVSVIARHMFQGRKIVAWTYQPEPDSVLWIVMDDGNMVGVTYLPEHDTLAFHRHELNGFVEDVATVPQGESEKLYIVVRRTIDGVTRRYIEMASDREFTTIEDSTFLDSHVTGTITGTTISGLDHLEGEEVKALVGGDVINDLTVTSGSVDLPREYTNAKAVVGLAYESTLRTLEPWLEGAYSNQMSIARLQLRVLNTRGVWAGADEDDLVEYRTRDLEDWGEPGRAITDTIELVLPSTWDFKGQVYVKQTDPLPCNILAVVPDVEIGG